MRHAENKEENQDHSEPFRNSNITPTCLQAGEGAAPGKGGPQPGWLLVGTQAGGQKEPSAQLRPPKEGECPAPSRGTVLRSTPLPAREPGRAQDTRDPGPAVLRRQEHPLVQEPGWRATLRPSGAPPSLPPRSKPACGDPKPAQQTDSETRTQVTRSGRGEGPPAAQAAGPQSVRRTDPSRPRESPRLGSGHLPTAPASHQGQSST